MGRGIERREILRIDIDRNDFIGRLSTLAQDGAVAIQKKIIPDTLETVLIRDATRNWSAAD